MSLSTCLSFAVGQYQSTMMRKLGKEDVADWFDNKPLFICEYYETDDVMAIIQEIDIKIDAPRTVMFKSNDEFYTFTSITSYIKGFDDCDLPF